MRPHFGSIQEQPLKNRISTLFAPCAARLSLAASEQGFAVASIKLHAPENPAEGMRVRPDGIDYTRVTLFECIRDAYHVAGFQISGADRFGDPMLSNRYDIVAKAEKPADKTELMSMLQTLLAERFKLRLHRETKDLPVFLLIVGKKGPRLTDVADDGPSLSDSPPTVPVSSEPQWRA